MKKILLLFLPFLLLACQSKESDVENPPVVSVSDSIVTVGSFVVSGGTPQEFTQDEVEIAAKLDEATRTLTLYLFAVSFSERMPGLDMIFPNVEYVRGEDGGILFQSEHLIPLLKTGNAYPDCPVENLTGSIADEQFRFQLDFAHVRYGMLPAAYEGVVK